MIADLRLSLEFFKEINRYVEGTSNDRTQLIKLLTVIELVLPEAEKIGRELEQTLPNNELIGEIMYNYTNENKQQLLAGISYVKAFLLNPNATEEQVRDLLKNLSNLM